MNPITFYKLQASGNDFILLDRRLKNKKRKTNYAEFAKKYCDRKFGIGADGVLVLEASRRANFKMRIFNADGSEAEMCGNGARCSALYYSAANSKLTKTRFETIAGIIGAEVIGDSVKIKTTDPLSLRLDFPIEVCARRIKANFINTGVPHTVILVEKTDIVDVNTIGRELRYHKFFEPKGTNVDFVEIIGDNRVKIRTYERGVESETFACGTGAVGSAIISDIALRGLLAQGKSPMYVETKSRETLSVYFERHNSIIRDVWLEGKAHLVFEGHLRV